MPVDALLKLPPGDTLFKLPPGVLLGSDVPPPRKSLACPEPLASVLPDGGLPRGAVVELAAPSGLAQGCAIAIEACAAAQRESRLRGGDSAWCAWLDPGATLYAPAVAARGVDLARLLVVRPPLDKLARIAVRVASSHVFSVVVVDVAGVPGAAHVDREKLSAWAQVVRRLAIGVEGGDTTVVLLTDARSARSLPLPVAMRIELERPARDRLSVRIAKERYGRVTSPRTIAWGRPGLAAGRPFGARGPKPEGGAPAALPTGRRAEPSDDRQLAAGRPVRPERLRRSS